MTENGWCVAVFKCTQESIQHVVLDLYNFTRDLPEVRNLHFVIRDRVKNEILIVFRILTNEKAREIIRSKLNFKLDSLVPGKFAVDPDVRHPMNKYTACDDGKRMVKSDTGRSSLLADLMNGMSALVIEMLKSNHFSSAERVEIAQMMSSMLGCTEYGKMSPVHWELGYYDRIEDKCCPCLRQDFLQTQKSKK